MSDITQWETRARAIDRWQEPQKQHTIGVIVSLLQGHTSPDDAAKSVEGRDIFGLYGSFWLIVCDAVRHLGRSQRISELLVDLLNALATPSATTSATTQQHGDAASTIHRLPQGWHVCFRYYCIYIVSYDEGEDNKDEFYGQAAEFLNATTFAAILLVRAKFDNSVFYDAREAMDDALVTRWEPEYLDQEWRVFIAPASTWILVAGEKIRELCLHGFRNVSPAPQDWELWKEKFIALSTSGDLDDERRELCSRAARKMVEVEGS